MRKWEKFRSPWDFWMCKIISCCHITEHCNGLGVRLSRNCHWISNLCPLQNDEVLCPCRRRWLCPRAAEEHPSQGEAGLGGDTQRHGKHLAYILSSHHFPFWTLCSSIPFMLPKFQLFKWVVQYFEQGQNASLPLTVCQGGGRSFHNASALLIHAPKQVL